MNKAIGTKQQDDGPDRTISARPGSIKLVRATIGDRPKAKSNFNISESVFSQKAAGAPAAHLRQEPTQLHNVPEFHGRAGEQRESKDAWRSNLVMAVAVATAGAILGFFIGRNRR